MACHEVNLQLISENFPRFQRSENIKVVAHESAQLKDSIHPNLPKGSIPPKQIRKPLIFWRFQRVRNVTLD